METAGKAELATIEGTVQHHEDCLSRLGVAMDSVLATILLLAPIRRIPLSLPERFDGAPARCKGFLLQYNLYLALYAGLECRGLGDWLSPTSASPFSSARCLIIQWRAEWEVSVYSDYARELGPPRSSSWSSGPSGLPTDGMSWLWYRFLQRTGGGGTAGVRLP